MQVVYQMLKKVQNRRCYCFNIHCLDLAWLRERVLNYLSFDLSKVEMTGQIWISSKFFANDIFKLSNTYRHILTSSHFSCSISSCIFIHIWKRQKQSRHFAFIIFFCFEEFCHSKSQNAKIHGKTDSKLISWLVRELFEWAPILETTKNDQKYKMFIPVLYKYWFYIPSWSASSGLDLTFILFLCWTDFKSTWKKI